MAAEGKTDFSIQTSGDIAALLYEELPKIVTGCADLEAPTNHKRQLAAFSAENPAGRYLHCGIREHAMGALADAIAPAMAETGLMKEMTEAHIETMKAKIPMGRFLQIDEAGALVAWIASPECSFTTGFVFDLSGGRTTY